MAEQRQFRQGEIYWLDDCPPLGLDEEKGRPVIVISAPDMLKDLTLPVLVVPASASSLESEADRIALPNDQDHPQTTSGLTKICWAIPRCYALIERERLSQRLGYVGGNVLRSLVTATQRRIDQDRLATSEVRPMRRLSGSTPRAQDASSDA